MSLSHEYLIIHVLHQLLLEHFSNWMVILLESVCEPKFQPVYGSNIGQGSVLIGQQNNIERKVNKFVKAHDY